MPPTNCLRTEAGFGVIYPHGAARSIPESKISMILSEIGVDDAEAQANTVQLTVGQSLAQPVNRIAVIR